MDRLRRVLTHDDDDLLHTINTDRYDPEGKDNRTIVREHR
jgi:hypothetical protein